MRLRNGFGVVAIALLMGCSGASVGQSEQGWVMNVLDSETVEDAEALGG